LRLFSFGGYGLALAPLALVVFGAYDSYPAKLAESYRISEAISLFSVCSLHELGSAELAEETGGA